MFLNSQNSRKQINDMKMRFSLPLLILVLCISCSTSQDNVGDIVFDSSIDDPNFVVCNENRILQYYNFGKGLMFEGEKIGILEYFNNNFNESTESNTNGYLTIRFIVNCQGETDRFRLDEMNSEYSTIKINESITNELLRLTRELEGWGIGRINDKSYDYYQYLTFKIESGRITDIMP